MAKDPTSTWVLAGPFRAHVLHLMNTAQVPWPAVAYQAGVPQNTVRTLLYGRDGKVRTKITQKYAAQLLELDTSDLNWMRKAQVNAESTGPRLRLLRSLGVGWDEIAAFLGVDLETCQCLARGELASCSVLVSVLAHTACESMGLDPTIPEEPDEGFEEISDAFGGCGHESADQRITHSYLPVSG